MENIAKKFKILNACWAKKLEKTNEGKTKPKFILVFFNEDPLHLHPYEVNYMANLSPYLDSGDVEVFEYQVDELIAKCNGGRKKRQVVIDPSLLWTLPIPYYFDSTISSSMATTVRSAVSYIQTYSCVRWQEDPNHLISGRMRVRFVSGTGCNSMVGMMPYSSSSIEQIINLNNDQCNSLGTAIHEMTHCMGFQHEHQRYDRDSSIYIDTSNVNPNYLYAYSKVTSSDTTNYNMPYDFGSVMHYAPYGFCVDCSKPVMIAYDQFYQSTMGSNDFLTFVDILRLNSRYNCAALCPNPPACQNNGIVNPNNCAQCICPKGFGGTLCDQRASDNNPSCGGTTLLANYYWKTLTGTIDQTNNIGTPTSIPYHKCFWKIIAPTNKLIQIQIVSATNRCNSGCTIEALELKLFDMRKTGYKFCCQQYNSAYTGNVTASNLAIVHFYTQNNGVCADTNSNCASWAASGECNNNPSYMLPSCPVSCNQCKLATFSVQYRISNTDITCYDQNTNCAYWASIGECLNNPPYMLPFCAASCNVCLCMDLNSNCAYWAATNQCTHIFNHYCMRHHFQQHKCINQLDFGYRLGKIELTYMLDIITAS
uniref:Metalloendopeptidase n=1 Tax=Acrobeloides nanus TaxID=290746 RepID=A0A914DFY9_9BILA